MNKGLAGPLISVQAGRVGRQLCQNDETNRRDARGGQMLYLVIERFRNRDAAPVYRRFREQGRLAPEGLKYVSSWVDTEFLRCFQVMECEDRALLEEWMARWNDLVEFEVVEVVTSAEAAETMQARL